MMESENFQNVTSPFLKGGWKWDFSPKDAFIQRVVAEKNLPSPLFLKEGKCFPNLSCRILTLILLGTFSCVSPVHAQEMAGQGWTASEPRQRPSSTISLAVKASGRNSSRPSSRPVIPEGVEREGKKEQMLPFPVATPGKIIYPRAAIRKGWEGQTVVAAEVLSDGSVGRTALAKTSGHEVLDQAAQDAIKTWKFGTESENEAAVSQYVDIPVTFRLEER